MYVCMYVCMYVRMCLSCVPCEQAILQVRGHSPKSLSAPARCGGWAIATLCASVVYTTPTTQQQPTPLRHTAHLWHFMCVCAHMDICTHVRCSTKSGIPQPSQSPTHHIDTQHIHTVRAESSTSLHKATYCTSKLYKWENTCATHYRVKGQSLHMPTLFHSNTSPCNMSSPPPPTHTHTQVCFPSHLVILTEHTTPPSWTRSPTEVLNHIFTHLCTFKVPSACTDTDCALPCIQVAFHWSRIRNMQLAYVLSTHWLML